MLSDMGHSMVLLARPLKQENPHAPLARFFREDPRTFEQRAADVPTAVRVTPLAPDGAAKVVYYAVEGTTRDGGRTTVSRRYSEFERLLHQYCTLDRVPARVAAAAGEAFPEKHASLRALVAGGGLSEEQRVARAAGLERFLGVLIAHVGRELYAAESLAPPRTARWQPLKRYLSDVQEVPCEEPADA